MMSESIQTATHANANHDMDEDSDGHKRVMEPNSDHTSYTCGKDDQIVWRISAGTIDFEPDILISRGNEES